MNTQRPSFVGFAISAILTTLSANQSLWAEEPAPAPALTNADVRATVTRSLPFIEAKGVWWIEEKKCVTCHRVGLMTWSLTEAARRGFAVDGDKLEKWTEWTLTKSLTRNEKEDTFAGSKNSDGLAQMLLGRDRNAASPQRDKSYALLAELLAEGQSDDGSWTPQGQLPRQKRPATETAEVSTMWNALALAGIDRPSDKTRSTVERASERLSRAMPGKSTEWYAARLLFATRIGEPKQNGGWQKRLRAVQNADGGWGWLTGESSDALATGISLFALCQSGVAANDSAVHSARKYLLETQRADGSWAVLGTKEMSKTQIEETSTYWGTTWATIGLLQTLPDS
jgi:squalene-hopene/tetraprenyl-beta-curcumene cyclase